MSLITRAQCQDYDNGFEEVFGRRCFYCKKAIDQAAAEEWEHEAHAECEKKAAAYSQESPP